MNLKLRLHLVFAPLFLSALVVACVCVHRLTRDHAQAEDLHDAQRMMDIASAVRGYTMDNVKPQLDRLVDPQFVPEAVPAIAATETVKRFAAHRPGSSYREVALNPTNPRNKASPWETELVNRFRAGADVSELNGSVATPEGEMLYVSRPIRIADTACLACHSTPAAAPYSLITKYGTEHGFGWQPGEVVGAQMVMVPMRLASQKAGDMFLTIAGTLAAVLAVLYVALTWSLQRLVVKPLRTVANATRRISQGDMSPAEFPEDRDDEIGSLQQSVNLMRRSLVKALGMLRS